MLFHQSLLILFSQNIRVHLYRLTSLRWYQLKQIQPHSVLVNFIYICVCTKTGSTNGFSALELYLVCILVIELHKNKVHCTLLGCIQITTLRVFQPRLSLVSYL
jgi:hypothetical protein